MNEREIQEHAIKEALKKVVDNNPNYPWKMKEDLKKIIDANSSFEEIFKAVLFYLSMCK